MTGSSSLEEVLARLATAREGITQAARSLGTARAELADASEALAHALPQRDAGRLGSGFTRADAVLDVVEQRLAVVDDAVGSFAGRL